MSATQRNLFDGGPAAIISDCGRYRYTLRRLCSHGDSVLNWIMLNPSKAHASRDDPTIRRCISYAKDWGYADILVTNLFALRSTDPKALRTAADPVGPENDEHIRQAVFQSQGVLCAWGADPFARERAGVVLEILRSLGVKPHVLALTRDGCPGHPLFLPRTLYAKPWNLGAPTS